MLQRNCTSAGHQWKTALGALALGVSQVSQTDLSRVGCALAFLFGLGQSLLRPATRQRQAAEHGPEGSGFQVDPDSISLLEGSQALLRRDLSSSLASSQTTCR